MRIIDATPTDETKDNILPGLWATSAGTNVRLPQLSQAQPAALTADDASINVEESEDDMEWEEIDIMQDTAKTSLPTREVEVIIEDKTKVQKQRTTTDPLQRVLRLESHKLHTIALLASFSRRNKWINDPLLHARLLSLTPLPLQLAFTMIHPKMQPDASRRGRLFETACFKFTEWWHSNFRVIPDKGIRSQTFLEVEAQRLAEEQRRNSVGKGKGKATSDRQVDSIPYSDRLRSVKSLMKHTLLREGSADTSALLFTALCRALDVPARLVVSLQPVPWSSKSEKFKTAEAFFGPQVSANVSRKDPDSGDAQDSQDWTRGEIFLQMRRGRENGHKIRTVYPRSSSNAPPLEGWPPVVWTEVFSRAEGRWIPIDPVRYLIDKKKMFEPPPNCRHNRMMYVVAFEEDGYARDVTLRYAREFGAKTAKTRASSKRGQSEWWARIVAVLTRPYRLNRDDIEDGELQSLQYIEGMPTSIGGFKDHPIYALERHLRKDEVIHPLQEVGRFRGEPVFPRSNVQRLRTAETWLREGKVIRVGQQPLKRIAQRAHTINRKRVLELAKADMSAEVPTQGLYAEWQTETYVPSPVIEGRIPKNDFGNVNLFVPSMLPQGAVHLPFQGIAKVARQLEVDFAPAVTGFEFRRGHANPIMTGIIVSAESEDLVLSAYWDSAQAAHEAEKAKRQERSIQRWTRLVQGLRLRKRLLEDYGNAESIASLAADEATPAPGGFLTQYEGVIEHFFLPKTRTIKHLEDTARASEEEGEMAPSYDPHHSWSSPPTEQDASLNGSIPAIGQDRNAPKSLRQHATDHYARLDYTQHESKPLHFKKLKPKIKTKRLPSSDSSASDSETLPSPKRPRMSKVDPSQPRRQLRSGVRKTTRQGQKNPGKRMY